MVSNINPQTAYVGVEVGPVILTTPVIANGANMVGFAPPGHCSSQQLCTMDIYTNAFGTFGPLSCNFTTAGSYSLCYR